MITGSRLEAVFASGQLAVTGECGPPRGTDAEVVRRKAGYLKGYVDAVNVTDNQTAVVRMSSVAACIHLKQMGLEPIYQMVCRDRNRIAMQSDILGAFSHGINTMLCLSGDHQKFGDHPQSASVFDIDSMQLIQMVRRMRDEGLFLSGEQISEPPKMFVGCAANPFAEPFELRVMRLAKKVAAGAEFVQTQCIFNVDKFEKYMAQVRDKGLHEKVKIMAGLTPMKSVGMARYMQKNVPGMDVPDELVKRLSGAPKGKQGEEGIKICVETIQRLRECQGVAGFHIMAIEWEEKVPQIVEQAGLLPRPEV